MIACYIPTNIPWILALPSQKRGKNQPEHQQFIFRWIREMSGWERELSMAERVLLCFIIQIGTPLIHDVAESRVREEGENGAKF